MLRQIAVACKAATERIARGSRFLSSKAERVLRHNRARWPRRSCREEEALFRRADHLGDVVTTLERLRFERGLPQRIYCDNGTEFVSAAMDL
jgi:hypothetical protein